MRTIPLAHQQTLTLALPAILMGIINVTPDSFSDGGLWQQAESAVAQGVRLAGEGAAILDIGGESTRPGSSPVDADEEIRRIVPVIQGLRRATSLPLSVDTMKAKVARAALEAGAAVVNDVWGFQFDPDIAQVAADYGAACVLMHNRRDIDPAADMIAEVKDFWARSIDLALRAGVRPEQILLDPGFGFGKTPEQNLQLVHHLPELMSLNCPILLGVSRKSTIGRITRQAVAAERIPGTLAAGLYGVQQGAAVLRVHDVAAHRQALQVWQAIADVSLPP
ncbi:dihydropteroate synthase [Methylovirgula sp. 4M-Z18]|uniref:dihydropteroate synthase n=1 Tax=Methylovirgula sp. 4M-Z18 TaxID=2293567 RepID=UPI000E2F3207|nr:dihydropteroate synthase [Methylovirgula sp. 4M-Z18]RFB80135.1 dihydropteroate synthase [Methylovirgula sp. 4M-Z18]